MEARAELADEGIDVAAVNCRFVKPLDSEMLGELSAKYRLLVTLEENTVAGGFGDGVREALSAPTLPSCSVVRVGLPDAFVPHGTRGELLEQVGLTPSQIARRVVEELERG